MGRAHDILETDPKKTGRGQKLTTKGSFKNHVDTILLFFDHPPTLVDIFYVLNVDKSGKF